jgi:hypothetical protein
VATWETVLLLEAAGVVKLTAVELEMEVSA